ncbi:hypothetical protein CPB97_002070 [Podila verticillata]|nr:hypothetical protein CPB97_002070 [Podila verticillata]
MAGSCGSQKSFDSEWWGPRRGRTAYMMEGLRCKCEESSMRVPRFWKFEAQDYCETGNMGSEFRRRCSERGSDCYAVDC